MQIMMRPFERACAGSTTEVRRPPTEFLQINQRTSVDASYKYPGASDSHPIPNALAHSVINSRTKYPPVDH